MVSIDPSQAQPRPQAHAPRAAQANAAQQIPATNFRRHFAIADGDCVFRVLHMDLTNQPGVQASNERVMELRQAAANYITEHRQALIAHPSFGGAAGVNNLYDLLMTPGQWNEDAGDLVAPILARVLGRELRILQPEPQGGVYEMNDNRIFRPQDPGLPPGRPDTGQPPIHLLHTGNRTHYEYLESRYPQADATAGSVHTPTRPVAHSVDDLGAPPSPEASLLGIMSPSLWLEEFARWQENSPTQGNLSRNSSLGNISLGNISLDYSVDSESSIKFIKELGLEQENSAPSGSVPRASSLGSISLGSISSGNMSLASMSSRKWLAKLTREEENSPVDDVAQPPRKRRRKAGLRPDQQDIRAEHRSHPPLRKKQVQSQAARTKISNAFTQTNNRAFEALTQREQDIEVRRISRETEYKPFDVRTTLAGKGNKRVQTQTARTEVSNAFNEANNRAFRELTKDEQDAEVKRISRKTGYNSRGVRSTLTGDGNMKVETGKARTEIRNAFAKENDRAFGALTQHEQAAEVARISRETEYNPSGVRTTLTGRDNTRVRTKKARAEISNAFTQTNNHAFGALTKDEQDAEVTRISRKTGYNASGVRSTLIGRGTTRVLTQEARTEITNAFTQVNDREFRAMTQEKQDAEVARISDKTGYRQSGVRATLSGAGNIQVTSQKARTEISNAFTQVNDRDFRAMAQDEQSTEIARISQQTGYNASGVRSTLTGEGNMRVHSQADRTKIINAFTQENDRAFRELAPQEQDTEVTRISRKTGYLPSGVRKTLTGGGNKL